MEPKIVTGRQALWCDVLKHTISPGDKYCALPNGGLACFAHREGTIPAVPIEALKAGVLA